MGIGMRTLLLLASLLLCLPPMARAQEDKPPPFPAVIPADGKINVFEDYVHLYPDRLPNGRTKLIMWGGIEPGDAERFRDAIEASKPISELVIIGSPGGVLDEGIKIGRIIRINKISTRIRGGSKCVSACNFVFLGGVIRSMDPGAEFITHVFSLKSAPRILLMDETLAEVTASGGTKVALGGLPSGPPLGPPPAVSSGAPPEPPPDEPRSSTEKTSVKSVSSLPRVADTVGKIVQPAHLEALGCNISELYTDDYDREIVQQEEIKLEAIQQGKDSVPEGAAVQDLVQLARLRALFLDYLCLEEGAAHSAAEIATFLIEMRLSLRFLTEFSTIANARPRPLTKDELRDYNIVNTE
jgi:hypothetical protein